MSSNEKHGKVQVVLLYKNQEESQLLLLQMNDERGGHWQNATGSVDPGESYEGAAKRELLEETGIDAQVTLLDLSFEFHDRWGKDVHEKVYKATIQTKPEVKICSSEHQSFKWIDTDSINQDHFGYPSNYQAFLKAMEN